MSNSDPIACSTPSFPVLPHLPEFAQTHAHWVSEALQPSHRLSPPSPPALNLSEHQDLFQWVDSSLTGRWLSSDKQCKRWNNLIKAAHIFCWFSLSKSAFTCVTWFPHGQGREPLFHYFIGKETGTQSRSQVVWIEELGLNTSFVFFFFLTPGPSSLKRQTLLFCFFSSLVWMHVC